MKIIKKVTIIIFFFIATGFLCASNVDGERFITTPVCGVRTQPLKNYHFKPFYPRLSKDSQYLHTQLLYGDKVSVISKPNASGWVLVRTPQTFYNKKRSLFLQHISGYVLQKYVGKSVQRYRPNAVVKALWAPVYKKIEKSKKSFLKFSCGTRICVQKKQNFSSWFRIQLLDGTHGYIKKNQILLLDDVKQMSEPVLRTNIVETAKQFVQSSSQPSPYVWGGRSAHDPNNKKHTTGVDCSGLTSLIYNNVYNFQSFPRTARDQYLQAPEKPLKGSKLKPGDLVFFAIKKGKAAATITHVSIYIGNEEILESTGLGLNTVPSDKKKAHAMCVRIIPVKCLIGKSLKRTNSGQRCLSNTQKLVFFGRYIKTKSF